MNPRVVSDDSRKVKPFKFSDSFLTGFNSMITTYDKKIEDLNRVRSLIDKDAHHGVCNCSYKMRYITPSDISTFISNLERAMENHLFKPHTSDCDLFAVESVKRFLKANKCIPFDAPTITGNPGADIPKGATLADLTFAAESEVFNLIVYSKYELEKRIDCMKEDMKKIQDMHFSAAVKQFVQKLPDIMNKKASVVMEDSLLGKACEVYIEDFIMFALRLNLCTVLQMLCYAVPRVSYKNEPKSDESNESANNADNWDEDNEFFKQEAVDETAVSPIYFIFTQGTDIVGKAISKATKSPFTHVSVSFDPDLDNMYSFSMTSFLKESIHSKKKENLDINVFGTFISNEGIKKMKNVCTDLLDHIKDTKYDYDAIIKKLFGKDNGNSKGYKQICTTFVNQLVGLVGGSLSNKNIPSPAEMREGAIENKDVFELYAGNSKDYSASKTEKKLKDLGKKKGTKRFDEVVTECCTGFLKTNDYMISNKIPFNCNMRDIVLQDMHPQFKDTLSALKFIMNDERSPVHQLVIQYYTEPIDDYDPDQIIKLFFGCPRHNHWECDPNSRDGLANNAANMNTDVNWLDKITYGNMFYDGNYRRDGLGNQHTHPVMNSFETIYKMFGGCDNICDNAGLSNSLIRISRVMKAIIERYCSGGIANWEMCRDILSVFGEIFTRHMLRLYYNENHPLIIRDQMPDAMGPGYQFMESFVMEANGFVSQNASKDKAAVAKKGIGNAINFMINWVSDKLSKFLPEYFKSKFQRQVKWFKDNGEKRYQEVMTAHEKNRYKFPKKNNYYKYNVKFNPSMIKVDEIVNKAMNSTDEFNAVEFKKELFNVFTTDGGGDQIAPALAKIESAEDLKKASVNAILFSQPKTEDIKPEPDHEITDADFKDIYESLKVMCDGDEGCKAWIDGMNKLSNDTKKALENLKTKYNITESYQINLDSSIFQEGDKSSQPPSAPAAEHTEESKSTEGVDNNKTQNGDGDDAKNKGRAEQIFKTLQFVFTNFYTIEVNTIVSRLFPDVYNNFKGILDDYDTTKNGGTDAKEQQTQQNS